MANGSIDSLINEVLRNFDYVHLPDAQESTTLARSLSAF
jgi:hypothetical protein